METSDLVNAYTAEVALAQFVVWKLEATAVITFMKDQSVMIFICSSDDFRTTWEKFLHESPRCEACPIFYRYVTDKVFKKLIFMHFPVTESEHHTDKTMDNLIYGRSQCFEIHCWICVHKKIARSDELKLRMSGRAAC